MKKIITVFFILFSTLAFGQEKATVTTDFNYATMHYNDTATRSRQFNLKVNAPVYRGKRSSLSVNLSYNSENFNEFPDAYGSNVHGIGFGLNWTSITGPRGALTIFGQTGMYSDSYSISSDIFRERIGFAYLSKHSDKFTLGFGMLYARQFYGNQVIPIIAIRYHFDDAHWQLAGYFPESPKLSYNFNKVSAISFELKDTFDSYRLTTQQDSGRYLKTTRLSGLLSYAYTFARFWKVSIGAGVAVRQKYELYDNTDTGGWYFIGSALGSKPQPVESIVHNGALLHIGLEFNPGF